jgi:hypothetical protein
MLVFILCSSRLFDLKLVAKGKYMKKYMKCVLIFSMLSAVQSSWTAHNEKQLHPEDFQKGEQALLVRQSSHSHITMHIQLTPIDPKARVQDDPRNLNRIAFLVSKSVPRLPDVLRDIVIDYVRWQKDLTEEAFQNDIDIALRRHRRVQLCTGIMLVGGALEFAVGLGMANNADSFALKCDPSSTWQKTLAGVGVACSTSVAFGSCSAGVFRLDRLMHMDSVSAELIERSKIARASAYGTTAIVICVLPLTALVGGGLPAIGPVVLVGGGVIGFIATGLALAKSCLRSRKLLKLQTVGE